MALFATCYQSSPDPARVYHNDETPPTVEDIEIELRWAISDSQQEQWSFTCCVPNRGRKAVLPKMQNGQYWPFHKTSDPERGRTSDLQNEVGRQRVASGALSLDSKLYQMHVSISPFPNRTGEFPRIRLSKGPAFALGRLNDRKRTMNKNNRHRTTLRVVVCAACLSALLPSRGVHWTCY